MNILLVFKFLSCLLFFLEGEVLFESIESKTANGSAVFNKVSLESTKTKDTWIMKQSHHGKASKVWDKVKIVVDKSKKPYSATYHQLNKKDEEIDYKVSCFRCHSGGPRLIRAKEGLSIKESLQVLKWNLLIKSYGDVKNKVTAPIKRKVAFIKNKKTAKHFLKVKSCTSCHFTGGPRSPLTKSQTLTIKHLIKNEQMPPWPYELTKEDRRELKKFIYGI